MGERTSASLARLPLMKNYFTVFDRTRNINGVIRFAKINAAISRDGLDRRVP